MRRFMPLLLVAMLAGCGSSPKTHYFALAPVTGETGRKQPVASPVTVSAVDMPPLLDRREMVRSTGPNSVAISEEDRWAAPIGEMARRVLSQDLAARLPEGKLVAPDAPAPPKTGRIAVAIEEFGPDASGAAVLKGSWSLLQAGGEPAHRQDFAFTESAPIAGADQEAAAMSRLLGQLAAQIADALASRA